MHSFWWLALQALELMILPPFCIAIAASTASLIAAGMQQRPFSAGMWRPYHWFVSSHVLFFVVAIAVGVFGATPSVTNPTIPHVPNTAAEHCLDAVTYASVLSCGFWIWRMKGFCWFAVSLLFLAEAITWGAFVVAGMSVTGDWL